MSNRWKIILVATFFNLLFEYSLRGVNNLQKQPFLPFILFPIYFTLFTMVEDLIVRFKLKDYQLMLLAFFYGTIYIAFTSGIVFINPTFFGIAMGPLLYVNLVWWGAIQAVLTFYLANLFIKRDWNHPRLSKRGWITCLLINFLSVVVFQVSGLIPSGTSIGRLTILSISIISLILCIFSIRRNTDRVVVFTSSRFLNMLLFFTVVVFVFCAVFLTHDPVLSNTSNVNALSLRIISLYTLVVSLGLLSYRIITKKEIPV